MNIVAYIVWGVVFVAVAIFLSFFLEDHSSFVSSLQGVSSLFTLFISMLALNVIRVAREDISIRSRRESLVLALQYAEKFKEKILGTGSLQAIFNIPKFNTDKIKFFIQSELSDLDCKNFDELMKELFDSLRDDVKKYRNDPKQIRPTQRKVEKVVGINSSLNEAELFAASIMSGTSDEEILFPLCAESFCSIVERNYVFYCSSRKDSQSSSYKHTIALYNKWSSGIRASSLKNTIRKMETELKGIPDIENQKIIGVEDSKM